MDSISILKVGYMGGKTLLTTIMNPPDFNKQILDPLSCIIRLGLLMFKEKHTKISISNNKIYFQPPNIFQGTIRWTYGDGRADLHNLCKPIERAIAWYDPKEQQCIENIFKLAINGLTKLKQSYIRTDLIVDDSNLVCHSISHYITLLQNRLNEVDSFQQQEEYDNYYFKSLWKMDELIIIDKLFMLAIEKLEKDEDFGYTINSIEAILQDKDNKVTKIVNTISTSL